MWGVFTLYLWVSTFRKNLTLWGIFLLLWITFFLLAGGDLGMGAAWHKLGGWFGLATGVLALYLSFAELTNETFGRNVIGVGSPILH
jgi:succinate-acetate transporter protein